MDTNLKVTETPTESSFEDILAGDNVVNIPLFQREYKWTNKNLVQFWADIDAIIDGQKKSQFLGVIVTVPQSKTIGVPPIYDVVDGQQRLFTCYIAVCAAVKVALDLNEKSWALDVTRSYLLLRQHSNYSTNTKVVPAAKDRQQFTRIWTDISNHSNLDQSEDWKTVGVPSPPAPSGNEDGKLIAQYKRITKKFKETAKLNSFENVKKIVEVITSSLSFVTISLRDPIAAPIIFERLNARGEKITTADLVRNEIFSRVASDPLKATTIFENNWEPFQKKFDERAVSLEQLLFPYGLTIDPNVTKAELFRELRNHWVEIQTTHEVIADLDRFSETLFALEKGEIDDRIPSLLHENLTRFHQSNAPSSIYTFIFKCVESVQKQEQQLEDIKGAFNVIEGFLVRRAVCGIEPTGLHAVFKGMWHEIISVTENETINAEKVKKSILKRTTVPWPDDDRFADAIKNNNLYDRRICKFILGQYEISAQGESPSDDFWVEHILPQTYRRENWGADFTVEQHEKLKNCFANLIPLTAQMNGQEGQNNYTQKRVAYLKSVFSTPRELAEQFEKWTPIELMKRAEKLSQWAIKRWPK